MSEPENDSAWEAATWEGSRRAQLRRALQLTVRERLKALEALSETRARVAGLGRPVRNTGSAQVRGRAIEWRFFRIRTNRRVSDGR